MGLGILFYLPFIGLILASLVFAKADMEKDSDWKLISIILIILNTISIFNQLIKHGFIL